MCLCLISQSCALAYGLSFEIKIQCPRKPRHQTSFDVGTLTIQRAKQWAFLFASKKSHKIERKTKRFLSNDILERRVVYEAFFVPTFERCYLGSCFKQCSDNAAFITFALKMKEIFVPRIINNTHKHTGLKSMPFLCALVSDLCGWHHYVLTCCFFFCYFHQASIVVVPPFVDCFQTLS